jgi:mannosylglycerate hydrolase
MSPRSWIVPHAHWDREWYLTFQDFRWKLLQAVDQVIDTLCSDPAFPHFMLDGQTVLVEDYLALRPERRASLEGLARSGRLSIGPWYVQPDDILVTGEALIRNLQRGLAHARELGAPMMVGYLPDSFGHIGSLPAILAGFGIQYAAFMRGPGPSLDKVFFHWSAQDGSRVLAAYLVDGYGNGAELPMEPRAIGEVLQELRGRQEGALFPGVPLLVMNGIDHRSIDSLLPGVLKSAGLGNETGIGSLQEYMDSSRGLLPESIPAWMGELRSVYRCPITVGCTSARAWIKCEDQAVSTMLERRAEPLSALASLLGAAYPQAALDTAWKYLLLNQPHDSICGCSIDAVHDDMKYRYAQARGLAANIAGDAARFIARALGGPADRESIACVNPGPARTARALSFPVPEVPERPVLQDTTGELVPVQVNLETGESALFFDEHFKPAQLRLAMGLVRDGQIMSYRIQDARTSWESDSVLRVDLSLAEGGVSSFDWNAWLAETTPLLNRKGLAGIHAVGVRAGRKIILFPARLPAFGARSLIIRSLGASELAPTAGLLRGTRNTLENEHYLVRVLRDGSLELHDKRNSQTYAGLGRLEDCGDRGDEYNYDPPQEDRVIVRPVRRLLRGRAVRMRLIEQGPVRATLRIEADYRVPASVWKDRRTRSSSTVVMRTVRFVSLAAGATRVEIRTEVENNACDHRLRVHFPFPGNCSESVAGGTFESVTREIRPESVPPRPTRGGVASDLSQELPAATHPFTGYVAAGPLAVLSRGSREYEILGRRGRHEIAVTLFRSVGWLSRADLVSRTGHAGMDIRTPGAQEQGRLAFEYAVTTSLGGTSVLREEWEDYRCPAEVVTRSAGAGVLGREASLLSMEGAGVTFSSLTRTTGGALCLRFFEHTGEARRITLRFLLPARSVRKTRLDGFLLQGLQRTEENKVAVVDVGPYEIVTIEVDFDQDREPTIQ